MNVDSRVLVPRACLLAMTILFQILLPLQAGAQATYSVSTLAPQDVVVPPIVLGDADLHAALVELARSPSIAEARRRLGISTQEMTRLIGLAEVEGLGRQTSQGWQPLALALDAAGVDSLRSVCSDLARTIRDTVSARWAELDSLVGTLPVAGVLPLTQTGYILVGDYLLGRFQANSFWRAGLAPTARPYAFRVYRTAPDMAPPGHLEDPPAADGWRSVRFAPTAEPFGFASIEDPEAGETADMAAEVRRAYRLWYLLGSEPGPLMRRMLQRLEAVDTAGRLRVPLISAGDLDGMRMIADRLGESLWPQFEGLLPRIGIMAAHLGYADPALLGETALWGWEMAVGMAMDELVERGVLLPPIGGRGQALVVPARGR